MRAICMLIGVAACIPYDKDLGTEPFLCGAMEPRCPMDYTCMKDPNNGLDVCVADGASIGSFNCADDSAIEPNDSAATATPTPVDGMRSYERDGLAICPAGDKDTFAITTTTDNENVEAAVTFAPGGAVLGVSILNAGGVPIATASDVTGATTTTQASAPSLRSSTYYVQVVGPTSGTQYQNNYKLTVNVTGP
jgi:hypothetical protein